MNAQNAPAPEFLIHRVYLKDASFESPNSPAVFRDTESQPDLNVQIGSAHSEIGSDAGTYEVVLTVTATAKVGDRTLFLAEVTQGGIFTLKGFAEAELGGMLGAYCPETLFPFAREAVAELVAKGGFPHLLLSPVNFNAMYTRKLERQRAGAAGQAG